MTLAEYALELSQKATEGPWKFEITDDAAGINYIISSKENEDDHSDLYLWRSIDSDEAPCALFNKSSGEFIAASRTLVPELARRLQRACEAFRTDYIVRGSELSKRLADELEKPLEEK